MQSDTNRSIKKFRKQVKRNLRCLSKNTILRSFYNTLDDLYAENSNLTYQELQTLLGTPKEIANEYMREISDKDLDKYRTRRCILAVIFSLVAILLLVLGYLVITNERPGVIVESSVVLEAQYQGTSSE